MAAPNYVLTRDFLDNNRINLQHYLWRQLFGYLIHPTIPTNSSSLRIADIGTGTGIWLSDLHDQFPSSVKLDGLDISFEAVPPPKTLPSNYTLLHYNVLSEVPNELVGVYDIVHIRNFSLVLKNDDIKHVMNNLFKLLKPGGYLQWAEPDMASFRIEKTDPANKAEALVELLAVSQKQDVRLRPTWVSKLPEAFEEAGLDHIQSDVKDAKPHVAVAMHECNLVIHELINRKTKDAAVAEKLQKLIPEAARETRDGSYMAFTRWTVVGRKPE